MPLALGEHRVHHYPGVVDGHVAHHLRLAGFGVDFHHGHVGSERECGPLLNEAHVGDQAAAAGMTGDLGPGQGRVRVAAHLPQPGTRIEHHVGFGRLEHLGGMVPRFVLDLDRRLMHGRAAELQRPRTVGPDTGRDQVGVAVDDRDPVHRDAKLVLHEHGPRGVVPLAVGRAAGVDRGRAVIRDLDLGGLAGVRVRRGDLHVGGQPDAELLGVAAGPPAPLLLAELLIARRGQRLVQRLLVAAGVVHGAGLGLERELVRGDEVAPPDLRRIHADLGGEQVDRALDGRRGLGPAGPPVGGDRRRVGDGLPEPGLHVRDVVYAGCHQAGEEGQESADARVRADVLDDVDAVGEDAAVAAAADPYVLQLAAALGHRDQVLAAGLGPAQRSAGFPGRPGEGDGVPVDADLAAEPAAYVGHHHAELVGRHAQGAGQDEPAHLRILRADPDGQPPLAGRRRGRAWKAARGPANLAGGWG